MTLVKFAGWAIAVGIAIGNSVVGTIAFPEMAIAQQSIRGSDRLSPEEALPPIPPEQIPKKGDIISSPAQDQSQDIILQPAPIISEDILPAVELEEESKELFLKQIKKLEKDLSLSQSQYDRSLILLKLGSIYARLNEYKKAIDYYQQALYVSRAAGNRSGESTILNNLGTIYSDLGEIKKAIEYYNQSLLITRSVDSAFGEAITLWNLGKLYSDLGEAQKAIEYYNQALLIAQSRDYPTVRASTSVNLGVYYHELGNSQKAIEYFNQALPTYRLTGDRAGEAGILTNLGAAYLSLGEEQKALDYYNQSLLLSRAVGDRSGEAGTLSNIAILLESQKQPELAIVFYKQSVSQYEILRQNIRTLPKETQETYTKTVEYTYRELADLLLKADRILEAQQVLDLLKVQELNEYLKNVRGGSQELYVLPPETEILKQFGTLQTSAIELGQKLTALRVIPETSRTQSQQQEIERLVQLQDQLNQQFNEFTRSPDIKALVQALARRSPDAYEQTVKTASLDALRDDLQKLNAVLIYPLILDDRLELIITTPDSPPLRRTVNVTRQDLNTAIKDFRTTLQNPTQDPKPIAQKLYNWLIKPLEADLKTSKPQTLIYAPDAQLRYIPLAALYDSNQPDGNQWLIQRYAINHITAQSLTDLTAQPTKTPKILAGAIGSRPTSIALGSDKFSFKGLPYTNSEVKSIQTLQPNTRILDGDNFSLPKVRPQLGDYNILHLATHASLVPKKVENSFILFGSQTYATLRDIESWSLNNFDLVILSACETGLGGNFGTGGEEILGLGYQFQTRGAKATIASLWQVNDGSTSKLMEQFYTNLSTGKLSKAAALRQAQITLIQGNDTATGDQRSNFQIEVIQDGKTSTISRNLSHPFYWAPFILIGNGL